MKLKGFILILLMPVILATQLLAQSNKVRVFTSGTEGHRSYRIPAIITLPNSDLLESNDEGQTWHIFPLIKIYPIPFVREAF